MIPNLEVIEPIINFRKTKYDKLSELIANSSMSGSKLNMFINLDTVLDKFYAPDILSAFKSLKGKELIIITSELFNLVAHYRNFFWTRYKVKTTFYIYYLNRKVKLAGHKHYMESKLERKDLNHIDFGAVNYVFEKNMDLISSISKYIKNCYFIPSNGLEPSVIPYYIIKKYSKDEECNLIMTSDKSEYNLTNLNNTFILRATGKNSKILSKDDIYNYKFKNIKYKPNIKISTKLYPLILAMSGYKDRNINAVSGFVQSCKIIESAINDYTISNSYVVDPTVLYEYLSDDKLETFVKNYQCLDTERHYRLMKKVDQLKIENNILDRYDNGAIVHLNSKYFETNNIQLIELCKGVD